MPILKHRLELQGISHVVSLVSFSDVKAFEENNFTGFTPKRRLNHRRVFRCSLYTYTTVALEVASKHCTLVGFAHYTSAGFVVIH